ncbi:FtsX-like permease family protein [Streptomyces sp. NPDC052042]|uniref:FtsX-like permease family protein n=1 Tax=Streptomyces sp. NPDC052042 TaxID=3365683 RepID=UPI0037D2A01C
MSVFTGWRAALRIAGRDAMRAKGRSALVVAMIAVPVLGVTALDVTYRSMTPSTAEKLTAQMGAADAHFTDQQMGPLQQMPDAEMYEQVEPDGPGPYEPPPPVDVTTTFPKGARAISIQSVPANVTSKYGIADTDIYEFRTSDGMARGKTDLVRGSYPHGAGEVAATEMFLKETGLSVGSTTTVRNYGAKFTITGVIERPDELKSNALFADPGTVIAPWKAKADHDKKVLPPNASPKEWLVKGPAGVGVTWPDILEANRAGVLVTSRQVVLDPPPDSEVPLLKKGERPSWGDSSGEWSAALLTVVSMAVLEIVLLAGPAFAVGARRSRRQLGLLGTCGGDRQHVRAVVLGGGLVLGGIGAVTGVVLGLGLTAVFRPMLEDWAGHRFASLVMRPTDLLIIAAVGLVTGLLAAFAPAVVASRQSVLESLSGRRGVRRSSRVLPIVGACVLALGCVAAAYGATSGDGSLVAVGSVVAELGMLGCIPVVVGLLGRLGRRLPLSPRMALRDAARNRGRTAPAVAAVMAAVAGSVAIATFMSSRVAESQYQYTPSLTPGTLSVMANSDGSVERLPLARAAVERNMPVSGGHAEFKRVWAGSDCSVYYEEENDCGTLKLVKPTGEGHTCPLKGKGARELAARLSADEHRELMNSPVCLGEYMPSHALPSGEDEILVADVNILSTYVKLDDPAAADALAAGTPVLLNPAYAKDGEITLTAVHKYNERDKENRKLHPGKARTTTDRLKVYVASPQYAATPGIRLILPQKTADRLGLHTEPAGSMYAVSHTPTGVEEQRTNAALDQAGGGFWAQFDTGPVRQESATMLVLTLFAGVVTLGAAAITTGLAKADAEADLTTLSAVGAPPSVRRALTGFQCLVVALTGVVLGTITGLVPAVALRLVDLRAAMEAMRAEPMESAYTPIVLPWGTLAVLVVGVPLIAGALAAAITRSRQTLTRRAG